MAIIVGTAGWTIPSKDRAHFPDEGPALERYSARFAGVEINSSFHRPHRASTWQKWAGSVPADFRFSVKVPKTITHQRKLVDCGEPLDRFLEEVAALEDKLAVLLIQLPPKLAFEERLAAGFLDPLAGRVSARLAVEPRHPSWFEADSDALLDRLGIARVAADPAIVPSSAVPGGRRDLAYWRLHGSPAMYRSSYDDGRLDDYAKAIDGAAASETWCMFDNTASSAATGDALALMAKLQAPLID